MKIAYFTYDDEKMILGENDSKWNIYKLDKISDIGSKKIDELLTTSNIKNIVEYVKKLNPDTISKTLNTVQKVIQIAQTFSGPKGTPSIPTSSIYSDWWD